MSIINTITLALKTLSRNKMRTLLTMLGIIIGVGSVIAMVAIASGAKEDMTKQIESAGTNMLTIFSSTGRRRHGVRMATGSVNTLTVADSEAIMNDCRHVEYSSPQIRVMGHTIYGNQNWSTTVMAGSEDLFDIRNWRVSSGRSFVKNEVVSSSKVCVIGDVVRDNLFGGEDPIGAVIRINKIPFRVIGVLEAKGQSGGGGSFDDVVIIPYTTAMQRMYKRTNLGMIVASAANRTDIEKAKDEITQLLRQRHRIKKGDDDDFMIRTQADRLEAAGETSAFLTLFLGAVASVSLLVGGIGIMNIMLVSVTERIREIGIRMAIGAKQRDILLQFIVESIVLSSTGGIIGIGLGYLGAWAISALAKWSTMVSIQSIMLSISFSMAIGLFFGLYPAWKASRLDPIQALRKE